MSNIKTGLKTSFHIFVINVILLVVFGKSIHSLSKIGEELHVEALEEGVR